MARQSILETPTAKNDSVSDFVTEDDFSALKKDISTLQKDFKKLFSDVSDVAKAKKDESISKGKDAADSAKEQFTEKKSELEGIIREKPLASVGVALGVGAVIALLAKR
ncbi:DUF883 family protein [Ponticaulis profundi]|uniref:YqjD family protein n=1 Tax=Ponticaulis profundi TaxID=2665222 RepID=A0ABW1SEU6_9PROT